jgi:hypothetical protein
MDHLEEEPPFALVEQNSPQHLFAVSPMASPSPRNVSKFPKSMMCKSSMCKSSLGESQTSTSSSPPGLVESMLTDGSSSVPSACDSDIIAQGIPRYLDASSTFLMSSIPTVSSSIGGSSYLPNSRVFGQNDMGDDKSNTAGVSRGSAGFSQLMQAADDANLNLGHSRMPMVPEHEIMKSAVELDTSGTLISAPRYRQESTEQTSAETTCTWLPNFLSLGSNQAVEGLREPLLSSSLIGSPLLSASPSEASIARSRAGVKSLLEDGQSFEVSMDIHGPCTTQGVMRILGNPELLKMWCDPIQTLIVTSSSDSSRESSGQIQADNGREYEGEWIEATTTALESPPSSVGFIYSAGQAVLDTLGFATYGRITMFVERQRGHVGLTVGPFSGGMRASHTISVFEEGGRIRIVDRVRLNQEEEQLSISNMFFCGALDSCFSSCLLPSVSGYMDQVATSMARLRLLVADGELSQESEIISAS